LKPQDFTEFARFFTKGRGAPMHRPVKKERDGEETSPERVEEEN
jgi:hypothetical protein